MKMMTSNDRNCMKLYDCHIHLLAELILCAISACSNLLAHHVCIMSDSIIRMLLNVEKFLSIIMSHYYRHIQVDYLYQNYFCTSNLIFPFKFNDPH
jgi:hypothetical protein